MKRLLALAPVLLLAFPAAAQDVPAAARQNLWCHIAFVTTSSAIPVLPEADVEAARAAGATATPEQVELIGMADQIATVMNGIPVLLAQANAAYTEAGFTAEQFTAAQAELTPVVTEQVTGGTEAEFSFEDCIALLAPAADAAAPAAVDPAAAPAP